KELLADLILRKMERKPGGTVILEVILVEVDRGAPGPVVEKRVVVEGGHDSGLEALNEVFGELADSASGVHEARQSGHEREPHRDIGDVRIEFIEAGGVFHSSTLTAGIPARRPERLVRSCPERT